VKLIALGWQEHGPQVARPRSSRPQHRAAAGARLHQPDRHHPRPSGARPRFRRAATFAVAAYVNQHAIRVATAIPQVIDSVWLIHRAQWPLSASAAWAVQQLCQQDWSMGMRDA
jgi:hypothetical protein